MAKKYIRTRLDKLKRFFKLKILHTGDSPHRIALGVALGVFVAWTPALGLHILMALGLAVLLRANKFAALTCVWVNNPLTFVAIYYPSYLLGRAILKFSRPGGELSNAQVREIFNQFDPSAFFSGFFRIEFWQNLLISLRQIGYELWLGSLIMGLLVAFAAYFVIYYLTISYQRIHPHRRFVQGQ